MAETLSINKAFHIQTFFPSIFNPINLLNVRLWAEYLTKQPPCWRGTIEGSEPGDQAPFTNLKEMQDLIQQKTLLEENKEQKKSGQASK